MKGLDSTKKRKCKHCKEYVTGWIKVPAGVFCNFDHAIDFANTPKIKELGEDRRWEQKKKKARDNDRSYWLKKAQQDFNAWVRVRDAKEPCISCQRHHQGQYHAGHYRSVGANPELRFEPINNNKQCMPCNTHLSGNLINYRINLLQKIGQEKLDWLEGNHKPKHYIINDLKEISKKYLKLKRELEKQN